MPLKDARADEVCVELAKRCAIDTPSLAWTRERREQFLVRLDVSRPLSVDHRVWPQAIGADGMNAAFSILLEGMPRESRATWRPRAIPVEEETERLGYDVADEVMTSGLSNCGYSDREKERIRSTWAGRINAFHLFDDADLALEFRALTEARVPEHAPFFVFGVYRRI